jgi:hypothetical protein
MSTRKTRALPAGLERTRQRFERWRRTRKVRTRTPDSLWASAVKIARTYGIHRTSKALRVDYYSLKKRVEQQVGSSGGILEGDAATTFLELTTPRRSADFGECVLELEDAEGAKMRVRLQGVAAPDLAALSRSFWGFE